MPYSGEEAAPRELKLRNEVQLNHQLDELNMDLHMAIRRAINFLVNIVGKKTQTQKQWESIGSLIESSNLTDEARLKLKYRHSLFHDYVKPQPKPLAYALLPLIVLWLAKTVWSAKMHERKIEKILEAKRHRRRLDQQKAKEKRKKEKGVLAKRRSR